MERARSVAKRLNAPLAIIDKRREEANVAEVMNVIGDVAGQNCLIVDDLIDTGGTLVKGADALLEYGAAQCQRLRDARGSLGTGRSAHRGIADQRSGPFRFDSAVG